jgi:5-methylcytosine-specific restriction endonuclease McrA
MRICSEPGCGRAVPDGVRFCEECKSERVTDDGIKTHTPGTTDRDRYADLYASNRFQDYCRPRTFQRDPFCKRCGTAPSVICDHIVPAGEAIRQVKESGRFPLSPNAGFFLLSNLQGLCRSCHGFKTNEDKSHVGEWPSVLEAEDRAPKRKWSF